MRKIKDFHEAWHFLRGHEIFSAKGPTYTDRAHPESRFYEALEIDVTKVDGRGRINGDSTKNTQTAVWLECGPVSVVPKAERKHYGPDALKRGRISHDINLDCGAPTFEKAIVKLANLVIKHYGDFPPLLEQLARAANA